MKFVFFLFLFLIPVLSMAQLKPIESGSYHWMDRPVVKSADREGRKFLEGTTAELSYLEIHASTQFKGAVPRPPHAQKDLEELIYIKEGTTKFTIGPDSKVLTKGSIVLVPPHQMQSIENIGDGPLTYYVFMFRSKKPMDMDKSAKAGGAFMLDAGSLTYTPTAKGGGIKYIQRPTAMLDELEIHLTELKAKGPSHAAHTHIETELILVLDGDIEATVNDKTYTATTGDICLLNGVELHGISNAKDANCKYLVIKWR